MPPVRTPYEAVLHAARDVVRVDRALDAELLGSALLGSVYTVAEKDRAAAVREFVGAFLTATARRRTSAARAIRLVFAALVPEAAGAGQVRAGPAAPPWAGQLGRVQPTGSYCYGDVYGDQTSYLASFRYPQDDVGGPEHAVVALVDHNIGIVKEVFLGPAEPIVTQVRALCEADDLAWFADVAPDVLRAEVEWHLEITDEISELPSEGSVATDRVLAGARLAVLPAGNRPAPPAPLDPAARTRLITDFLDSAAAAVGGIAGLPETDQLSLDFVVGLILDHADTFSEPDPLRWSPSVVELFMLDWVHRRAVLDDADAAMLPVALAAWVGFAGERRGLAAHALQQTRDAVADLAPEFARLHRSGERRSPATRAVAALMADGVDLADPAALNTWLQRSSESLN